MPEGAADFHSALAKLGDPWGIEEHGLGAKVYPSCGYTHRCVDAAIEAREKLGIGSVAEIEGVSASLPTFHLSVLPYGVPQDRTEALFSTAYCVATALATGNNVVEDFSPQGLEREDILALTRRVEVSAREPKRPELNFDPDDPDSVEVRLVDGRRVCCEVPIYTGAPGRDLDPARFRAKFESCHRSYTDNGGVLDLSAPALIEAAASLHAAQNLLALTTAYGAAT